MSKILLHDQQYSIGGPAAVLKGIAESCIGRNHELVRIAQPGTCGYNPIKAIKFILHYRKDINKYSADAIYICGLQYTGLLMVIAAKLSNVKKAVLSVHGSDWDNPDGTFRKFLLMYIVEPLEIFLADSVFTVCNAAQKRIRALKCARKGCNAGVVYNTMPSVDYNSIESNKIRNEFKIRKDKILVSVVGRVVKNKGHQFIIEAIKKMKDDNYVFMIVGDGDYLNNYRTQCTDEISKGQVILTGARNDVNYILKDSDIFLFATLNENHSIALLEAVNMHCAVLCTDVGGNPEIIQDMYSGLLIPSHNSDAIVDGLMLLRDEQVRSTYTKNAYNDAVNKFSIENTYGKLEEMLTC